MDEEFWLDRWRTNRIGFHGADVNPWLVRHWGATGLESGDCVFVPLCGKSLDMRWLESRGHPVIGVELASVAVEAYFAEAHETALVDRLGSFTRHCNGRTTLYCGDFFALTKRELASVRGVYDRAALIALPPAMRTRYAEHLLRMIRVEAQILLVTLEHTQPLESGPPFSVEPTEVQRLFGARCRVQALDRENAQVRDSAASEAAYLLVKQR